VTSLTLGKLEGMIFIIGIIIGIGGLLIILQNEPIVYNDDIELESGSFLFKGFLEGADDTSIHSIRVLENSVSMHIVLRCGGNDFDVYGANEYTPSTEDYEFRGYEIGGEDFSYDYPTEGIWHIMVHSYSGAGQYELQVDVEY
jgi:hypothetical protein